jgi:hypothetical protein
MGEGGPLEEREKKVRGMVAGMNDKVVLDFRIWN